LFAKLVKTRNHEKGRVTLHGALAPFIHEAVVG